MNKHSIRQFQTTVRGYYRAHGRHDMPWRQPLPDGSFDPYRILVSEVMLQQTQVARVTPKYQEFLTAFPSVGELAGAPLGQVLAVWSGLGYNRRAKYLWQAAGMVMRDFGGAFPAGSNAVVQLTTLPGVGPNTAGAIAAYVFNQPVKFIETNIRSVFIHHFFAGRNDVGDAEITALVEAALDRHNPREWYWALMDYGAFLKATTGNQNRRGKAYRPQPKFDGSRRQVRGHVLRLLAAGSKSRHQLQAEIADRRLPGVLDELLQERMISRHSEYYRLG